MPGCVLLVPENSPILNDTLSCKIYPYGRDPLHNSYLCLMVMLSLNDLSKYHSISHINLIYLFIICSSVLAPLPLTPYNTSKNNPSHIDWNSKFHTHIK